MAANMRMTQVKNIFDISPHMRRIVLIGDSLDDFPVGKEGGYVKAIFPDPTKANSLPKLGIYLGFKKWMRSYTIRRFDEKNKTLTLDFAVNDHEGLASNWASNAKVGDYLGIAGPGEMKHTGLDNREHLLFGDLTALPAIATILEKLPSNAQGSAYIQVPSEQDIQGFRVPENIDVHWLVTNDKKTNRFLEGLKSQSTALTNTAIFIATEASIVKSLKGYLNANCEYNKQNLFASAYWNQKA